jgi:predicted esterase
MRVLGRISPRRAACLTAGALVESVVKMSEDPLRTDLSVTAEIKLYYDLYVPENIVAPAPLLVAVHGYGAHKRYMMHEARSIAPPNFVIASIQGPHQHFRQTANGYRVGFGWLTDHRSEESVAVHQRFVNAVIELLAADGIADANDVHLFGFSQACALNFRYAFTFPNVPKSVIGVCGGIPGDLDTNPDYKPFDSETFYLYGNEDEFYPLDKFERFDQALNERLPNYRSKRYNSAHAISDEMRTDMASFLIEFASQQK